MLRIAISKDAVGRYCWNIMVSSSVDVNRVNHERLLTSCAGLYVSRRIIQAKNEGKVGDRC